MISHRALLEVESPFSPLFLVGSQDVIETIVQDLQRLSLTVFSIRGNHSKTLTALMLEFEKQMSFPSYFGRNKDALNECIIDLDWLPTSAGYVLLLSSPDQCLVDEGEEEVRWFVSALTDAIATWADPVTVGEPWDRPALPFHVVLTGSQREIEHTYRRWENACGKFPRRNYGGSRAIELGP
ncbi:MAG: barstar family protein [Cellulomonadaceae bacterium]|jgi:hypothetical protein|nr:barstar family protein [Cellulomonadaceae bacterium]